MNPVFASDLQLILADCGLPVVWGAFNTSGLLDFATEDFVAEDGYAIIRGETPTLTYFTPSLPGLKAKDIISVGGVSYKVRRVNLVGDGLQAIAYLEPA